MGLFQIVFSSTANIRVVDRDLLAIQANAALNNSRWGITGVLMYCSGHFIQLLEGDILRLAQTFERICTDPRHRDIVMISFHPVRERLYESWSLGCINLDKYGHETDQVRLANLMDLSRNAPSYRERIAAATEMFECFIDQVELQPT